MKESIRAKVSDFPRVAITHTVTENAEGSIELQQYMTEALHDYNAMFGTNYEVDSLRAYNTDLNDRLARKKSRYKLRENQLDIVIVVDRLLTGFDAPPCAILFVDRPPMAPQNIIQAFSRTNRIYDKTKRFGMVVISQRAEEYKKAVDDALWLYSNGGTNDVSAPTFKEIEAEFKSAITNLRDIVPSPAAADDLQDRASMVKFVKSFQAFDRLFGEVQVYTEWSEKNIARDYGIAKDEIDVYTGKYQNVLEILKAGEGGEGGSDDETVDIDIEYELETVRTETVDYRYLMALIQKHIPDEDQLIVDEVHDDKVEKYIAQMEDMNPALAAVIKEFWENMKENPMDYKGMDAMTIIEQRIDEIISSEVDTLVKDWSVKKSEVLFVLDNYKKNAPISIETNYADYKDNHGDSSLNKLKYSRKVKEAVSELAQKIMPLRIK